MKRLLFFLLIIGYNSFAQLPAPIGPNWKTVSITTWKYNVVTHQFMAYKAGYLWNSFISEEQLKIKLDSLISGLKQKSDSLNSSGYFTNFKALSKLNWTDTTFLNKRDAAINNRLKWSDTTFLNKRDAVINSRLQLSDIAGKKDKSDSVTSTGFYTNFKALSKINISEKGQQGGVATLDQNGQVPTAQINGSDLVHKSGSDTITGLKYFSGNLVQKSIFPTATTGNYGITNRVIQTTGNSTSKFGGIFNTTIVNGTNLHNSVYGIVNNVFDSTAGVVTTLTGNSTNIYTRSITGRVTNIVGSLNTIFSSSKFNNVTGFQSGITNTNNDSGNQQMTGYYTDLNNSGTSTGYAGIWVQPTNTGTLGYMHGAQIYLKSAGGTVETMTGIYMGQWTGSPTNAYGIHITSNALNGTVDNAAIWSETTAPSKFAGSLTSSTFIKSGGTSRQFLMADGSTKDSIFQPKGNYLVASDISGKQNLLVNSAGLSTAIGGDVAVVDGGTGTSTGSITGTGALTYTAGGTNQNVTLTPSGTGYTILNGNVGIGTTAPLVKLTIAGSPVSLPATSGTTQTGASLRLKSSDNDGILDFGNGGGGLSWLQSTNAGNLSATYNLSLNPNGGNVGIGDASPTSRLHLAAGSATAGTAPLGFTSGTLLTTPVTGKMEFLTDAYYGTITTGSARKQFAFTDAIPIITGKRNIADTISSSGTATNYDLVTGLAGKMSSTTYIPDSSNLVHRSGIETITGAKTFNQDITVNGVNVGLGLGNHVTNLVIGIQSLSSVTSGLGNHAFGYQVLSSNTSGYGNFGSRFQSLYHNTVGNDNNALGTQTLSSNISGNDNVAIGYQSLYSNTTASSNIAIGNESLYYSNGRDNIGIGCLSLHFNVSGGYNTALGTQSLQYNIDGDHNIAIGNIAGNFLSDEFTHVTKIDSSLLIGYNTHPFSNNDVNEIVIGHLSVGHGSNTATWGNTSITDHYFNGALHGGSFNDITGIGTSTNQAWSTGSGNHPTTLSGYGISETPWTGLGYVTGGPYLPLSGGTLTGPLNGTSAVFSSTGTFGSTQDGNGGISIKATYGGDVLGTIPTDAFSIFSGGGTYTISAFNRVGGLTNVNFNTGPATFSSTVAASTAILSNLTANYLPKHTAGGLVNSPILITDNSIDFNANKFAYVDEYDTHMYAGSIAFEIDDHSASRNLLSITDAGQLNVPIIIPSTNSSTGSLVVAGGVGVGGAINSGSSVTATSIIKSGGTASQFLKADGSIDGATYLTGAHNQVWGTITGTPTTLAGYGITDGTSTAESGIYTPTLTNTTNITSSGLDHAIYSRVGNIVHVSIAGDIVPTANGQVVLTLTLPITTTTLQNRLGVATIAVNAGSSYVSGEVLYQSTTTIRFYYISPDTNFAPFNLQFDYQL